MQALFSHIQQGKDALLLQLSDIHGFPDYILVTATHWFLLLESCMLAETDLVFITLSACDSCNAFSHSMLQCLLAVSRPTLARCAGWLDVGIGNKYTATSNTTHTYLHKVEKREDYMCFKKYSVLELYFGLLNQAEAYRSVLILAMLLTNLLVWFRTHPRLHSSLSRTVSFEGQWCDTCSCLQMRWTLTFFRMPPGRNWLRASSNSSSNNHNNSSNRHKQFHLLA